MDLKSLEMSCSLCAAPAVGVFYLNSGCLARPNEKYQGLCLHHLNRSTPLDDLQVIQMIYNRRELNEIFGVI